MDKNTESLEKIQIRKELLKKVFPDLKGVDVSGRLGVRPDLSKLTEEELTTELLNLTRMMPYETLKEEHEMLTGIIEEHEKLKKNTREVIALKGEGNG